MDSLDAAYELISSSAVCHEALEDAGDTTRNAAIEDMIATVRNRVLGLLVHCHVLRGDGPKALQCYEALQAAAPDVALGQAAIAMKVIALGLTGSLQVGS